MIQEETSSNPFIFENYDSCHAYEWFIDWTRAKRFISIAVQSKFDSTQADQYLEIIDLFSKKRYFHINGRSDTLVDGWFQPSAIEKVVESSILQQEVKSFLTKECGFLQYELYMSGSVERFLEAAEIAKKYNLGESFVRDAINEQYKVARKYPGQYPPKQIKVIDRMVKEILDGQ